MASVNVCMMCGSDPVNGECPECGGVRPLVTRAARADMILPRDCDGGLADLAAKAAGYHPDERIGIADDDADNAAMIARDLDMIVDRLRKLRNTSIRYNTNCMAYITGQLVGVAGVLESLS